MKTVKIDSEAGIKYVPCGKIDVTIKGDFACHKNVILYTCNGQISDIGTLPPYDVTHLPTGYLFMTLTNKQQAIKMITLLNKRLFIQSIEEIKERRHEIESILRTCRNEVINH